MKMLPEKSGYRDGKAGFYDLGGVFSHTLNERNKLNIYGYYSHDRFAFNDNQKYAYNNMNFSANWRSIFSEKLTANFSFGYDHYDYRNDESVEEAQLPACHSLLTNGLERLILVTSWIITIP